MKQKRDSINDNLKIFNPTTFEYDRLIGDKQYYEREIEKEEAILAGLGEQKAGLKAMAAFDESKAERYEKVKKYEDITLLTVILLSMSIIFMIFTNEEWKFSDWLGYVSISRTLFAAGLIALIARVYLYTVNIGLKILGVRIPFL